MMKYSTSISFRITIHSPPFSNYDFVNVNIEQ